MNHFKYSLKEPALTLITQGVKKVEGRLCKNTFKNINSGDMITFYNKEKSVDVIVSQVKKYNNFSTMLTSTGLRKTTPLANNLPDALSIYHNIYSQKDIETYGVLAIHLKKIKEN